MAGSPMNRWLLGTAFGLVVAAGTGLPSAVRASSVSSNASGEMLEFMATAPLRYGGEVSGPSAGHLLLALQAPGADGHLQGRALLLGAAGEPKTSGTVSGSLHPGAIPGGAACTLDISFSGRRPAAPALVLDGVCSPRMLSGTITTQPPARGWFIRQILWWHSGDTGGRYWLTRTGFNGQSPELAGRR